MGDLHSCEYVEIVSRSELALLFQSYELLLLPSYDNFKLKMVLNSQ